MKRAFLVLAFAALPLAACSGKAKDPAAKEAASAAGKAGNKEAHVNPWAKDSAPEAEASLAAGDKAKPAAKPSAAAEHVNPWAKDPPPGSEPSDAAKDKAKDKKAK